MWEIADGLVFLLDFYSSHSIWGSASRGSCTNEPMDRDKRASVPTALTVTATHSSFFSGSWRKSTSERWSEQAYSRSSRTRPIHHATLGRRYKQLSCNHSSTGLSAPGLSGMDGHGSAVLEAIAGPEFADQVRGLLGRPLAAQARIWIGFVAGAAGQGDAWSCGTRVALACLSAKASTDPPHSRLAAAFPPLVRSHGGKYWVLEAVHNVWYQRQVSAAWQAGWDANGAGDVLGVHPSQAAQTAGILTDAARPSGGSGLEGKWLGCGQLAAVARNLGLRATELTLLPKVRRWRTLLSYPAFRGQQSLVKAIVEGSGAAPTLSASAAFAAVGSPTLPCRLAPSLGDSETILVQCRPFPRTSAAVLASRQRVGRGASGRAAPSAASPAATAPALPAPANGDADPMDHSAAMHLLLAHFASPCRRPDLIVGRESASFARDSGSASSSSGIHPWCPVGSRSPDAPGALGQPRPHPVYLQWHGHSVTVVGAGVLDAPPAAAGHKSTSDAPASPFLVVFDSIRSGKGVTRVATGGCLRLLTLRSLSGTAALQTVFFVPRGPVLTSPPGVGEDPLPVTVYGVGEFGMQSFPSATATSAAAAASGLHTAVRNGVEEEEEEGQGLVEDTSAPESAAASVVDLTDTGKEPDAKDAPRARTAAAAASGAVCAADHDDGVDLTSSPSPCAGAGPKQARTTDIDLTGD